MNKKLLKEIDARIKVCLDAESKAEYLETLYDEKKIGKLEFELLKQKLFGEKSWEKAKDELSSYVQKAVELKHKLKAEDNSKLLKSIFFILLIAGLMFFTLGQPKVIGLSILGDIFDFGTGISVRDAYDFKINTEMLIKDSVTNEIIHDSIGKLHNVELKRAKYDITVKPIEHKIKSIDFKKVDIKSNISRLVRIDSPKNKQNFADLYAIDPTNIDFEKAEVTISSAKGNKLMKCRDWDFENRRCDGEWAFVKAIVPGQDYSFELSPGDPAFAEVIEISMAQHLDERKIFISDIYDSVKEKDGVWSEPLYENEYVRVTFKKPLNSSNDITVYARNVYQSDTDIEVYLADSDEKIAEFPRITETGYYKIYLTEMSGNHDAFDIKIVNHDANPSPRPYLEFDHIVDPLTVSAVTIMSTSNSFIQAKDIDNLSITTLTNNGPTKMNITDWRVTSAGKSLKSIAVMNFPFEPDGAKNGTDYSTFGKSLTTITGDPVWGRTNGYKKTGGYIFNGNDYLTTTDSVGITGNQQRTILLRVNATSFPNQYTQPVIHWGADSLGALSLIAIGDGRVSYYGYFYDTVGTNAMTPGYWHQIGASYDGTDVRIYLDGKLDTGPSNPGALVTANSVLDIGYYGPWGGYFNGAIDDVMIFNRTLTDSEIFELNKTNGMGMTMYSYETSIGENWSVRVCPSNATFTGTCMSSNNISIVSTITDTVPIINNLRINSTHGTNKSSENITAYWITGGPANIGKIINVTDWRVNGKSIAVLNMPFERNATKNASDYSTFQNHATVVSSATWMPASGYLNTGAYKFDGKNDYISVPTSSSVNARSDKFTITAWINRTDDRWEFIAGNDYPDSYSKGYAFFFIKINAGYDGIYFDTATSNGKLRVTNQPGGISFLPMNKWNFVVATYNGTHGMIYVNGVLKAGPTAKTGNMVSSTNNLIIGTMYDQTNYFFNGTIDELKIYNRSLSLKEILVLNASRSDLMHSNELKIGDNWSIAVTPVSSSAPGVTKYSNNITIRNAGIPTISSITKTGITTNSAVINWTTDIVSNTTINYGTTRALGTSRKINNAVTFHNVTLLGLNGHTLYYFNVSSCGSAGCTIGDPGTFTTLNSVPSIANVLINSTYLANSYTENITAYWTPTDAEGDRVVNITDWRMNRSSIAFVNLPFEASGKYNATDYSVPYQNNGTVYGNPFWNKTGGYRGTGAYRLDGLNDYINVSKTSYSGKTVVFWAKNKTGTWVHYADAAGTQYVNGVATSFTNTYYSTKDSNILIGRISSPSLSPNDPSLDSNLVMWLDASNSSSITNDSLARISNWADVSGTGNNMAQATLSKRPTYILNDVNGHGAIRMAGASNQRLEVSTNFPAPVTVLYVAKIGADAERLLSGYNNNWLLGYWGGSMNEAYFEGWVSNPGTSTDTNWHVWSATIAGAGSDSKVYGNGNLLASNQDGITGPNGLLTSSYGPGNSEYSDGDIAEIIVYDKVLSDTDLGKLHKYLSDKYAITLSGSIPDSYFNGTIDDFTVYNRTLSSSQIMTLYRNKTNFIVSQELKRKENWTACVTPNDGIANGATTCSNTFTIGNKVLITSIYPNQTGKVQGIPYSKSNVAVVGNYSTKTNLTFNVTATPSTSEKLTFRWFVNQVLRFTEVLSSIFTSMFKWMFSSTGSYNVTVVVNGSESYANDTFTFRLTAENGLPVISNLLLNSTHRTNFTTENLTAYWAASDPNANRILNITDWRITGKSLAIVNMPFEADGSQNATGYSTYGNNGKTKGNPVWTKTGGHLGTGSYSFDGSSQYVNITYASSLDLKRTGTLSAWVNLTAAPAQFGAIISKVIFQNYDDGYAIYIGSDRTARLYLVKTPAAPSSGITATSSVTVPLKKWTYIAGTWNGTKLTIYVNGVEKGSAVQTFDVAASSNPVRIGAALDGSYLNSYIDDVRIYNRSLSANEIKLLNLSKDHVMHSDETKANERWQSCITPNDGITNGVAVCSNNVTIRNIINITRIYPNQSNQWQGITTQANVSIIRNHSVTNNMTFNVSVTADQEVFTFRWFVNQVLKFTNVVTNGFTSMFKWLFNTVGTFNVTVVVNGSEPGINDTFTFRLNTTNMLPIVNNVRINTTHGRNFTNENITLYWNSTDFNRDRVINITDWRIGSKSIATVLMPFERSGKYNGTDYSSFGNNVTQVIGATWSPNVGYKGTGAYKLDGNDYLAIPDSPSVSLRESFTVSARINISKITELSAIVSKGIVGGIGGPFTLFVANDTTEFVVCPFPCIPKRSGAVFGLNYGGWAIVGSTSAADELKPGVWYNIVGTYNGTAFRVYTNGVLKGSGEIPAGTIPPLVQNKDLTIGVHDNAGNFQYYFNGTIDDVRLYNRTLSENEIKLLNASKDWIIHSDETTQGDQWSACITPHDGYGVGTTRCSNNVTIVPPGIYDVTATPTSNKTATVSWRTIAISNGTLNYGLTRSLGTKSLSTVFVFNRSLFLTGLKNHTFYFFNVSSYDEYGNKQTNGTFNFTTYQNGQPIVRNVTINSTHKGNFTTENLTAHWASTNVNPFRIYNITDWRVNKKSIAVLNMPFEADNKQNATDYSSFGNNGTSNGAQWIYNGGPDGSGAYNFSGGTNITAPTTVSLKPTGNFTIELWLYRRTDTRYADMVSMMKVPYATWNYLAGLRVAGEGAIADKYYFYSDDLSPVDYYSSVAISLNTWHHIVTVVSTSSKTVDIYLDGKLDSPNQITSGTISYQPTSKFIIGADYADCGGYNCNLDGMMDNIRIYNRSLSAEEIYALNKSRTDLIVSQETKAREIWQACVTPTDILGGKFGGGTAKCSNNITIRNIINITQIYPNQSSEWMGITTQANVSIVRNYSVTTNMTFNVTITGDQERFTFRWFVNQVLKFTNVVTNGFTSMFKWLFSSAGQFNVTVIVNGSRPDMNDTFTFRLTTKNTLPTVTNVFVNATHKTNYTNENLTVYWTSTDVNRDKVVNITDWRVNGKSIAVLNMPFEADGKNNATDYSAPRQDNGTIQNATWLATGGYQNTGAYVFGATKATMNSSCVNMGDVLDMHKNNLSIAVWFKTKAISSSGIAGIVSKSFAGGESGRYSLLFESGSIEGLFASTALPSLTVKTSQTPYIDGNWHFAVLVYNREQNLTIYMDGVKKNSASISVSRGEDLNTGNGLLVGAYGPKVVDQTNCLDPRYHLNGTIDNVMMFNRTLSLSEIKFLNSSRNDKMSSDETIKGERWQSCITPNDGNGNGATVCSNNVTIKDKVPVMTSISINSSRRTNFTNENLSVYWTSTDADNDGRINITDWRVNGRSIATVNLPFEADERQNATDYSTNNFTMALVGSPYWNKTGGWKGSGVYQFNGLTNEIRRSSAVGDAMDPKYAISVFARIKPSSAKLGSIICRNGPYILQYNLAKTISFSVMNASKFTTLTTTATIEPKNWSTIVGVYNGVNITIYLNGVLKASTPKTGTLEQSARWFRIGYGDVGCANYFNGTIDDLRIYNRSLSGAEIKMLNLSIDSRLAQEETKANEKWQACITPNDGSRTGATLCSNNITIRNIINITRIYPNQSNQWMNITTQANISIVRNYSLTTNLTFNVTATPYDSETLTFRWFVNQVLKFTQTITSGFMSMFKWLFSTLGFYNVTVTVNGSRTDMNDTFTFKLNIKDGIPPMIKFNTKVPADISSSNLDNVDLNITYNVSDDISLNHSTVKLYYKVNATDHEIWRYINGTSYVSGYQPVAYSKNKTGIFTFLLEDDDVYPATFNIRESEMENTVHTRYDLSNTITYLKVRLFNVSIKEKYNKLEFMANGSSGATVLRIYYCNATYLTGNPSNALATPSCAQIGSLSSSSPYNETESSYSKLHILPFTINRTTGLIGTTNVKVTSTSFFVFRGSTTGKWSVQGISNISRGDTAQASTTSGATWSNFAMTPDLHLHQYNGTETFNYYACANDTSKNRNCTSIRRDLIDLAGLPPSQPIVYLPTNKTYGGKIRINYTASVSPNGYAIKYYNISLLTDKEVFVKTIKGNNSLDLNLTWNSITTADGYYVIRVKATDILNQFSYGYSENFTLKNLVNITRIYPNQSNQFQGITTQANISIVRNYSTTTNMTFNATVLTYDSGPITFRWFVNQVLRFTQVVTNGFTSMFKWLFSSAGKFNVTVITNVSGGGINDSFTWRLTTKNNVPIVTNVFVNATHKTNLTTENLTVYWTSTDVNGDKVINITDWRVNSKSIAVVNLPFEADGKYNATSYTTGKQFNGTPSKVVSDGLIYNKTGGFDGTGAYIFNKVGNASYVQFANDNRLKPVVGTIAMRVKPNALTGSYGNSMWFYGVIQGTNLRGPQFATSGGTGRPYLRLTNGTTSVVFTFPTNPVLTVGIWSHIAATWNGTSVRLYFDGVLVSTQIQTITPIPSSGNVRIGNNNPPKYPEFFNGTIDDLMVFNRSLSSAEIGFLNNSRYDKLSSDETIKGEKWSACITPNDGTGNGNTLCSNNITIRNIINITRIYPNQSNQWLNITTQENVTIVRNYSVTNNLTFNATAVPYDSEPLTFRWFVNQVLKFTQTVTSGFMSMFKWLFTSAGNFNVTVVVNGTVPSINDTFTWKLTTKNTLPTVTNVFVNATHKTNYTDENLTVYWTSTDVNRDKVINITDWRINGKSIAILNMPFEADGKQNATDYSSYGNGASKRSDTNSKYNVSGGINGGGAYIFNGGSYINTTYQPKNGSKTWMADFNPKLLPNANNMVVSNWNIAADPNSRGFNLLLYGNTVYCQMSNSSGIRKSAYATMLSTGTWYRAACTYDSMNKNLTLYVNGVKKMSIKIGVDYSAPSGMTFSIGAGHNVVNTVAYNAFNGTIDNVLVFNRTLSEAEIKFLNISRNDKISSDETIKGEKWSACITPNDRTNNGVTVCSNNVTIRNKLPVMSSVYINSTKRTNFTDENLTAYWTSTDTDNDGRINITDWRINGNSITVLNMPFEADGKYNATSYTSGKQRNATAVLAVWSRTGGHLGTGAYKFDGNRTGINLSDLPDDMKSMSVTAWINSTSIVTQEQIFDYGTAGFGLLDHSGAVRLVIYNNTRGYNNFQTAYSLIPINKWNFISATTNYSETSKRSSVNLYLNGKKVYSATYGGYPSNLGSNRESIGYYRFGKTSYFNGTIDDVQVYNRSLSSAEIKILNLSRYDKIAAEETRTLDRWQACITPNDGAGNGNTLCSNNITIRNYVNFTRIYPNQSNVWLNITTQANVSIVRNFSVTNNMTFNITASTKETETLTFRWFVNQVLKFTQVVTSGFMSMFKWLFSSAGNFNVTVVVNGTDSGANDTFTWRLTTKNTLPNVTNVRINSTYGTNYTDENLTVYWNSTDVNRNKVTNITDWRMNGKSIAVLNMPFEADGRQNATDYSSPKQENGTVYGGAKWNKTGGYLSTGAYRLDGKDDRIISATGSVFDIANKPNPITVSYRVYPSTTVQGTIIAKGGIGGGWAVFNTGGGAVTVFFKNTTNGQGYTTGGTIPVNQWSHVVIILNGSSTVNPFAKIYINGVAISTGQGQATTYQDNAATNLTIGIRANGVSYATYFNGTIDDVMIFNRTLSLNEIKYLNSSRYDKLSADETVKGETWQSCVTPNDGIGDGNRMCSNNILIRNKAPTAPTLLVPNNGNNTLTNLTVFFKWTQSTDADGDPITYYLNLTSRYCTNSYFQGITPTNYTSPELKTVDACGYYNWSVKAYDGTSYGLYSTIFNFSIQPSIILTLIQNTSNFGQMLPDQTNDTSDNNPPPLVVQSDSNVIVNVNSRALNQLWTNSGLGNNTFMFKANTTLEPNSFNYTGSNTSYIPIKSVNQLIIRQLKFHNTNDTAAIDINVTVPNKEPPGLKSSNLIVEGVQP